MRILLGTILVLIVVAAGCQPSMLDQCREAVASRVHSRSGFGPIEEYACGERFWEGPSYSDVPKQMLVLKQAGFTPDEVKEWGTAQIVNKECKEMVLQCLAGIPVSSSFFR